MKVDKERMKNQIDEIVNYGAAHCEECDLTVTKVMQVIEPLILAVEAISQMQPEWVSAQPISEETSIKLADTDSKLIICLFDNGEVRRLDEDHPFALLTHFHFIPQPPTK